ncbi:putative transposase IS605 family protein [Microseira wollei NIES-4236]|uniref:Transposase IS605 family protein n=1 Tax=Microseira wollei NIES-4236 TaxID=2530354 RepID=A0AAV3XA99_9CYAN|nr:putative transposase IS605 family protein [Microseira wollei NIES-4236]
MNLKALSKRNKAKQDEDGRYLPNGQSAKSGLNKSWNDAAFGQFFTILEYIAAKAGARTQAVKPAYTSQLLAYRDEFIFTDCDIREYWDDFESLWVDRDVNAAINIKRVGLGLFPTIKRRKGNPVVVDSTTNSTSKEVHRNIKMCQKPTLARQGSVGSSPPDILLGGSLQVLVQQKTAGLSQQQRTPTAIAAVQSVA